MGHQCTVYVVKSPVLGLQRAPENSELAPSVLVLSDYPHHIGLCPYLNLKCSTGPDQRLSPTISEWGLFSVLLSVEIV